MELQAIFSASTAVHYPDDAVLYFCESAPTNFYHCVVFLFFCFTRDNTRSCAFELTRSGVPPALVSTTKPCGVLLLNSV